MTACGRCRSRVWWAVNERTGNRMILDDQQVADGNVVVCGQAGDGTPVVRVLTRAELDESTPMLPGLEPVAPAAALEDRPRYQAHQVTCGRAAVPA